MSYKIIASFDDGHFLDLRTAKLLKRYNIPAIFFIPNKLNQLRKDEIIELARDFEIGGHTTRHPDDIKQFNYLEQLRMIVDNKIWLENIIDRKIKWFAYPSGRYNHSTIDAVKEAGFDFARGTHIGETNDNYQIRVDMHVYPKGKPKIENYNWFDWGLKQLAIRKQQDEPFHFFGHSEEINRYNLWDKFEEFLCRISQ